jgi:tetratricopeptide (TPR) repeat protein
MIIAVVSIAKNEEQFVKRWAESARMADYRIILDTGSTDDTVNLASLHGVRVHEKRFTPWRFDHARNHLLSLVPDDVDWVINLDMDEVLLPGWREALEKVSEGVTRPRYRYVWSWNPDGSEGLVYGGDKIHSRHGYSWKHPVHETLTPSIPEVQEWCGLEVHHFPDCSKPRSQYLPLLQLAVEEDPSDSRNAYYYGRELYYYRRYEEAAEELKRFLNLPTATWKPERSAAMTHLAECEPTRALYWLTRATQESPDRREPWVKLAKFFYEKEYWRGCHEASQKALTITEKPLEYLNEAEAWGSLPYDLSALSAYHLGKYGEALVYGARALEVEPENERLRGNLKCYQGVTCNKVNPLMDCTVRFR